MIRSVLRFALHYLEMVLAMVAGMFLLDPVLGLVVGSERVEVDSLVMATSMSVAMAAWMWFRGHGWRPVVEMALAMYAGFVVLFPFLWSGSLDAGGVLAGGHVLMLVFMLAAMLARPKEYATSHASHASPASSMARRLRPRLRRPVANER